MRKTLSIILALLVLFNSMGLFIIYFAAMEKCRMQAMEFIHSHHSFSSMLLVTFEEGQSNFQLLNKGEIMSHSKLYDIVKVEKKNNQTIYSAISDENEDVFWAGIAKLVKHNTGKRHSGINAYTHIGSNFIPEGKIPLISSFKIANVVLSSKRLFLYQSPFGDIFSPPPQAINS